MNKPLYEIKSLIFKEKNGSTWAMVCYDSVKNKSIQKELEAILRKAKEK